MGVQRVRLNTSEATQAGAISRVRLVNQAVTGPAGPSGAGSAALDDLTDVTITAAAAGDLLRYSGTAWVDSPDSAYATASSVSDHLSDTVDAHDASAISFSPVGTIAGTDVQTAIAEVATDAAAAYQPLATVLTNTTASFTTAQESKLSGIESSADVTDATNVAAAGAVMEGDTSTASMSFVIDEDNMATNSDTKVPTQQSVKAYADTKIAGIRVEEEGTSTVATAVALNFVGTAVTVTDAGSGEATVTITGGSGSSDPLDGNAIVAQRIFVR